MPDQEGKGYLADLQEEDYDDVVSRKRQRALAAKVCQDMCLFGAFLAAFTIVVLASLSADSSLLVARTQEVIHLKNSSVPLESVNSIDTLYVYVENFFDVLFTNTTDTELAKQRSRTMLPLDTSNRLFGTVQIRQWRVQKTPGCQVGTMFSEYKTDCYPVFSTATESQQSYGNGLFQYTAPDPLQGVGVAGEIGDYPAGGFFMQMSSNSTKALAKLANYKANNFIDIQTRAVALTFSIWNSNLDQYSANQILFELPAVGKIRTRVTTLVLTQRVLTIFGGVTAADMVANVMDIVVLLFVLWYIAEELSEISIERWGYLEDGWNIMDWINMGLLLTAYTIRMTAYMEVGNVGTLGEKETAANADEAFTNLQGVANKTDMARLINAINAVLLWGKCVKYVGFFPYVHFLFNTIKESMAYFAYFIIIFAIIQIGFVISFVVSFGDVLEELNGVAAGWLYTIRSVCADIDVLPIYDRDAVVGAIFILLYYIVVILVAINVFFSIMAATLMEATYDTRKAESQVDEKSEAIVVVLQMAREYMQAACQCQKRLKQMAPGLYKRIYGNKKDKKDEVNNPLDKSGRNNLALTAGGGKGRGESGEGDKSATRDEMPMLGLRSTENMSKTIKEFTPKEVMRAVENLAGRVLSKIHACGIEVRIEVLRVQESLGQMVGVAEALSIRMDKIYRSQEKFLKDFAA
mmetsp:Transcript_1293/g.2883  ORF Transcript_1293/g.2883 Transcript_1293/m.2883 type:complete len:692 (-) Transcript_1293:678-2753(-)